MFKSFRVRDLLQRQRKSVPCSFSLVSAGCPCWNRRRTWTDCSCLCDNLC